MIQPPPLQVFISYSHKDDQFRRELEVHLSTLQQQGIIAAWSDRAIEAGQEWEPAIRDKLETADIILLLVSADFLASRFIAEIELQRAMARHAAGQARVIPVLLRPCDWQATPFGKLQAVPDGARPIAKWGNRDEAFTRVMQAIRQAAESLCRSGSAPAAAPTAGRGAAGPPLRRRPRSVPPGVLAVESGSGPSDRTPPFATQGQGAAGHGRLSSRSPWLLVGLGSGMALLAIGAWVLVTLLSPTAAPDRSPNVSAQGGSVAVGRDVQSSPITIQGPLAPAQPSPTPATTDHEHPAASGSR